MEQLFRLGLRFLQYSSSHAIFLQGVDGATTVASTSYLASLAGVKVFVTGGMGGVHRGAESTFDVSADLSELAQTPIVVVCAGVKSILDVEKTLEVRAGCGVASCLSVHFGGDLFCRGRCGSNITPCKGQVLYTPQLDNTLFFTQCLVVVRSLLFLCNVFPPQKNADRFGFIFLAPRPRISPRQVLETNGVPVISYGTDEFPAFFSPSSGVQSPLRLDRPSDVAAAAKVSVGWRVCAGRVVVAHARVRPSNRCTCSQRNRRYIRCGSSKESVGVLFVILFVSSGGI